MNFTEVSEKINSYKDDIKINLKQNLTDHIDNVYKSLGDLFENLKKECCSQIDNQVDTYINIINQDLISLGHEVTRNLSCLSNNLAGISPNEEQSEPESKMIVHNEKDSTDSSEVNVNTCTGTAEVKTVEKNSADQTNSEKNNNNVKASDKTANETIAHQAEEKEVFVSTSDINKELNEMPNNIDEVKKAYETLSDEQKADMRELNHLQNNKESETEKAEETALPQNNVFAEMV